MWHYPIQEAHTISRNIQYNRAGWECPATSVNILLVEPPYNGGQYTFKNSLD